MKKAWYLWIAAGLAGGALWLLAIIFFLFPYHKMMDWAILFVLLIALTLIFYAFFVNILPNWSVASLWSKFCLILVLLVVLIIGGALAFQLLLKIGFYVYIYYSRMVQQLFWLGGMIIESIF